MKVLLVLIFLDGSSLSLDWDGTMNDCKTVAAVFNIHAPHVKHVCVEGEKA